MIFSRLLLYWGSFLCLMHSTQNPLTRVRFTITNECPFFATLTTFSGFTNSVFSYAESIFSLSTCLGSILMFRFIISDESALKRNFPIEVKHKKHYLRLMVFRQQHLLNPDYFFYTLYSQININNLIKIQVCSLIRKKKIFIYYLFFEIIISSQMIALTSFCFRASWLWVSFFSSSFLPNVLVRAPHLNFFAWAQRHSIAVFLIPLIDERTNE